jgi:hypothetical protein
LLGELNLTQGVFCGVAERRERLQVRHVGDVPTICFAVEDVSDGALQ